MNKKKTIPDNVTETILESISDGVFTVDHEWRIMSFNRAAEQILSIPRTAAIGKHCWEVFRANMCDENCSLKRTMKEGKSFINSETHLTDSMNNIIPVTVSTSLLKDKDGNILGGLETFRDHSHIEELKRQLSGKYQIGNMVSRSKAMHDLFNILEQVAKSDSTVLIEGETGTGKEVLARTIHDLSRRSEDPYIGINCGALPDSLLESELFGYKAGAFTDAKTNKQGVFAAAGRGTILLDEIGDTSASFQVRLLRVLEEKKFQPLGSVNQLNAEARIIAATNQNLEQMVAEGNFRQDLFYRLNIITLKLPPLRERQEDIPLLIEHFIEKIGKEKDKTIRTVAPEAMNLLLSHEYPGNIRELENIIEHAFVLCEGEVIMKSHLPSHLQAHSTKKDLAMTFEEAERNTIINALERNQYNRTQTAKKLGIHKSTLFRKIKKLNIKLP